MAEVFDTYSGPMATTRTHEFHGYAEVVAALADPALVPIAPTESASAAPGSMGTAAWLRAHVARFAHGPQHARRRALIEAELARIDPEALRASAAQPDSQGLDPRGRAACLLAQALGLADPERIAADVGIVAAVYFGGDGPDSDAAVARLVEAFTQRQGRPSDPEEIANSIGILVQAYEATGSLVEHAAAHLAGNIEAFEADSVVRETLRYDPPLTAMRRVAVHATRVAGVEIGEGDRITLEIARANRDPDAGDALTFGSEPRRCPGSAHALALAAGILESACAGKQDPK